MYKPLKSPTKASFRGLFDFIYTHLIVFTQIRDCGIYLILIINYSIIVATLQIILRSVVFIVFLVRFYTLNHHISYYVFVFQKIIKFILSAQACFLPPIMSLLTTLSSQPDL